MSQISAMNVNKTDMNAGGIKQTLSHCGKSLIASVIIIGGETDTWTRCCNKPLITNAESSQVPLPLIYIRQRLL